MEVAAVTQDELILLIRGLKAIRSKDREALRQKLLKQLEAALLNRFGAKV